MNTKKQTLIESINRQRKLMGLNEIMDVNTNIDAKGALSGNKLDLGMVPLEEMDPDDDDDDDESKMDSDYYDERSDDERDFYRGEEPMSLDDRMDMEYPDPNEREWQANRYGRQDEVMDELGTPPGVSNKKLPPVIRPDQMMNEAELDEGFGDFIGGLKNVGQMAGKAVGGAAQKAGQAIGGAAQKAGQAIGGAAQKAGQAIGSAYNVGALSNQVSNVEKTMNKTMGDIKNYLDKNAKVYNDIANLQTQITSLSPQLQKELGAQLKKLGNTATSLTNLKKVVNPTMRTTGAGVAGSTNMAQSGRTTP